MSGSFIAVDLRSGGLRGGRLQMRWIALLWRKLRDNYLHYDGVAVNRK